MKQIHRKSKTIVQVMGTKIYCTLMIDTSAIVRV